MTPLTRAIGEEVGSRGRFFNRWDLAVAFWQLDLANETVWVGDEGTTEVGGSTRRQGVELETRYEITKWLAADVDVTFTKSQFKANAGNGNGLALAPKQTYSGGLSARHALGPGIVRGGLRFYGITRSARERRRRASSRRASRCSTCTPAIGCGASTSRSTSRTSSTRTRASAQFATTGRLRTEPALGAPVPLGFNCGSGGKLADGRWPRPSRAARTSTSPLSTRSRSA